MKIDLSLKAKRTLFFIALLLFCIPFVGGDWVAKTSGWTINLFEGVNLTFNHPLYTTIAESQVWFNRTWLNETIDDKLAGVGLTDVYVNETGDTMSGNLDMDGNKLTDVGELIVETITLKGNLTPYTNNLYNLGDSTHWLANIWVKNVWADNLNASSLITTDLNSAKGDIENITSTELNLGGNKIINVSGDMVVVLS